MKKSLRTPALDNRSIDKVFKAFIMAFKIKVTTNIHTCSIIRCFVGLASFALKGNPIGVYNASSTLAIHSNVRQATVFFVCRHTNIKLV